MKARTKSFSFLCQCIAPHLSRKDLADLKQKILLKKIDWLEIVKTANKHLVVPALWFELMDKELIETLDEELVGYLRECHRLNLKRNLFLKQVLSDVILAFNRINIEPILFKGSAGLYDGLFPDLGIRIMSDTDVLVHESDLDKSITALFELGYHLDKNQYEKYGELDFVKKGEFANSIDLHIDLEEREYPLFLPIDDLWEQSSLKEESGLKFRFLSPTHQVQYHIMHTEIHHQSYYQGLVDLRQLYDFSQKTGKFHNKADWISIQEIFFRFGLGTVFQSYLYLSKRLMNTAIPVDKSNGFSSYLHFRRIMFYENRPKLSATIRLIYGFFNNLSREMICQEYNCKDNFLNVSYWRVRRLFELAMKFSKLEEIRKLWGYHTRF